MRESAGTISIVGSSIDGIQLAILFKTNMRTKSGWCLTLISEYELFIGDREECPICNKDSPIRDVYYMGYFQQLKDFKGPHHDFFEKNGHLFRGDESDAPDVPTIIPNTDHSERYAITYNEVSHITQSTLCDLSKLDQAFVWNLATQQLRIKTICPKKFE